MDNNNLKISIKHPKGDDGYRIFSIRVQTEMINIFLDYALNNYEIVTE